MSRVADSIVTRGLKNTFRFGPGFGVIANTALENLVLINDQAGKPAKTVIIVNEDSLFGSGLAKLLNAQLPTKGFQILETIPHPTPTRDFNNVVLKIKAQAPDLVIPANYYNEYVLLARTMQEQHVRPKAIYSVLGGAASSYKFVREFPDAAKYIMDCNHWFNPKSAKAMELKKKVEDKGQFYTYELYMNYTAVMKLVSRRARACGVGRSCQTHGGAGKLYLLRSHHALWSDQIRQWSEPGRRAGKHAGARQRYQSDLAGGIRQRKGRVSDAGVRMMLPFCVQ